MRRYEQDDGCVHLFSIEKRRNVCACNLKSDQFPNLSKVAVVLMSMRTTACSAKRNCSEWSLPYAKNRANLRMQKAGKLFFLHENQDSEDAEESAVVDFL